MAAQKIVISLDQKVLAELDRLVGEKVFANRSGAIEATVQEKLRRVRRNRLVRECAKLDPAQEQAMAEEGMARGLARWAAN